MSEDADIDRARREGAAEWAAKLSRDNVGTGDLEAFQAWRRDPANSRAWEAHEAERQGVERFVVRSQTGRYRVVDIWTGETAVIAMTPQDDLSEEDAHHTAGLLNRRAAGGDRSVLQ